MDIIVAFAPLSLLRLLDPTCFAYDSRCHYCSDYHYDSLFVRLSQLCFDRCGFLNNGCRDDNGHKKCHADTEGENNDQIICDEFIKLMVIVLYSRAYHSYSMITLRSLTITISFYSFECERGACQISDRN